MVDEAQEVTRGLSAEKRAELETKYPRLKWVVGADDEWEVALIPPPKHGDVKLYRAKQHVAEEKAESQENLWKKMVVYVWTKWDGSGVRTSDTSFDGLSLNAFLDVFPMAPEGCSTEFAALIGLKTETRAK